MSRCVLSVRGHKPKRYHFQKERVRLTTFLLYSAMRNRRARTVCDIASRALLLVVRTCLEMMRKPSNKGVQLHRSQVIRPERHHMISSAYIRQVPPQRQVAHQYAVQVPQIRQATTQYKSSQAPSTAMRPFRIKPGSWTLSSCTTSRHAIVKS
jgi:hypothetical protein